MANLKRRYNHLLNNNVSDNPYVEIANFRDPITAEIAYQRILSVGIDCIMENQHLASNNWLWSNALGGVKLFVPRDKEEEALSILQNEPIPEIQETVEIGKGDCPNCGSSEVKKYSRKRITGILSLIFFPLLLIAPLLLEPTHWYCLKCGHKWK
jgi:hypothetical protein